MNRKTHGPHIPVNPNGLGEGQHCQVVRGAGGVVSEREGHRGDAQTAVVLAVFLFSGRGRGRGGGGEGGGAALVGELNAEVMYSHCLGPVMGWRVGE